MPYPVKRKAEILTVTVRSLQYRIYRWGSPHALPVFLLHGWADTGMSFQFLADELPDEFCVIAPDWRGFGDTQWNPQGYWFPDYVADLDAILEHFSPHDPARLVGHSMGGNVVLLYAGIRAERVSHVVSLEQYGLEECDPGLAPERYERWLQQWRRPPTNAEYGDLSVMVTRLGKLAPRMPADQAEFLAPYWCRPLGQGGYTSKIDPGHKRVNPVLYRRQEARACWQRITARPMLVLGAQSELLARWEAGASEDFYDCFNGLQVHIIPECGHMLHLDQPRATADLLTDFLTG